MEPGKVNRIKTGITLENYWINSYLSTLFIFHADNRIMADTDVRD